MLIPGTGRGYPFILVLSVVAHSQAAEVKVKNSGMVDSRPRLQPLPCSAQRTRRTVYIQIVAIWGGKWPFQMVSFTVALWSSFKIFILTAKVTAPRNAGAGAREAIHAIEAT